MVHLCEERVEVRGKSISEMAADVAILIEIVACAAMLESGHPVMGFDIVDMIAQKAKSDLEDPKPFIWDEAKDAVIDMLKRGDIDGKDD